MWRVILAGLSGGALLLVSVLCGCDGGGDGEIVPNGAFGRTFPAGVYYGEYFCNTCGNRTITLTITIDEDGYMQCVGSGSITPGVADPYSFEGMPLWDEDNSLATLQQGSFWLFLRAYSEDDSSLFFADCRFNDDCIYYEQVYRQ